MPIAKTKDNLKLNEYLQEKRKLLKINLEELAQKTQVQSKYLKRIERGEWLNLPSAVYTKAFLKRYAAMVGADGAEVVARYEKELTQLNSTLKDYSLAKPKVTFANKFSWAKLRKLADLAFKWRRAAAVVIILLVVGYIGWQLGAIFVRPSIELVSPKEDFTTSESLLEIVGRTNPAGSLTINSEVIYLKENGEFSKEVELLPGLNFFELRATSHFGKETKVVRKVIYNP